MAKKKILVIDDEELIIKSLGKLLEKCGYDVFVVKRGEDAEDIIEEESFDLIISDIKMPGINGIDLVKRIFSSLEKRNLVLPLVMFITGYADPILEDEAKKMNPIAFIHKPFEISMLVANIKKFLG